MARSFGSLMLFRLGPTCTEPGISLSRKCLCNHLKSDSMIAVMISGLCVLLGIQRAPVRSEVVLFKALVVFVYV